MNNRSPLFPPSILERARVIASYGDEGGTIQAAAMVELVGAARPELHTATTVRDAWRALLFDGADVFDLSQGSLDDLAEQVWA